VNLTFVQAPQRSPRVSRRAPSPREFAPEASIATRRSRAFHLETGTALAEIGPCHTFSTEWAATDHERS
jgi:hypothetical protein